MTLVQLGEIEPAAIPVLNDAIAHGYLRYGKIRPIIRLDKLAVFGVRDRRLLVALASITPFEEWNACRTFLQKYMGIDPELGNFPRWNPHVTLAELGPKDKKPKFTGTYMWEPEKVEMVYKTKPANIILTAWRFD